MCFPMFWHRLYCFRLLHPYMTYFFRLLHPYMTYFFRLLHPYTILLPTIASVYHTSSDYCIRIYHTSSDYCIRICTTVSDLLATPKQCPTIYSAPTLLFPTYCIATSNRAIASACIPPIPMYWHAHIHIGVILLHVLYCFRVINNT